MRCLVLLILCGCAVDPEVREHKAYQLAEAKEQYRLYSIACKAGGGVPVLTKRGLRYDHWDYKRAQCWNKR